MSTSTLSKPSQQTFEFTRRKRWTETLFSEISETILLIVSPTCKVLYCGSAIVELLGWKEDQLVDADLCFFIEDEDQENFRWSFTQSLHSGEDLFVYARFKYDQPPSLDANAKPGMLFEIKGHAHYAHGQQEPPCFFLSAMPYPSRDIALLNTFIDLKIENEKLSRRIHDLKNSVANPSLTSEFSLSAHCPTTLYPQRFNQPTGPLVPNHSSMHLRATPGPPLYTPPDASGSGLRMNQNSSSSRVDMMSSVNILPLTGNDDSDDIQRRKKLKKALGGEEQRVCVTCGRTDSPEWRKGPHGPKTLCNACGLRWAKRTRKTEPDHDTSAHVQNPNGQVLLNGEPGPESASLGYVNISGQQLMFQS